MKAITVRQPWAWAIVHGGKNIENRSAAFPTYYRGRLAIHAAGALSTRGLTDLRVMSALDAAGMPAAYHETLPRGAIVGVCELVDVHDAAECCEPWGESEYRDADGKRRTAVRHLVLEDISAVTPFPCRGYLGLWGTSWKES